MCIITFRDGSFQCCSPTKSVLRIYSHHALYSRIAGFTFSPVDQNYSKTVILHAAVWEIKYDPTPELGALFRFHRSRKKGWNDIKQHANTSIPWYIFRTSTGLRVGCIREFRAKHLFLYQFRPRWKKVYTNSVQF